MKKLKLKLQDLKVESFEISQKQKSKGTVKGQELLTIAVNCSYHYCDTIDEGYTECDNTCLTVACGDTCNPTCISPTCGSTCEDPRTKFEPPCVTC